MQTAAPRVLGDANSAVQPAKQPWQSETPIPLTLRESEELLVSNRMPPIDIFMTLTYQSILPKRSMPTVWAPATKATPTSRVRLPRVMVILRP